MKSEIFVRKKDVDKLKAIFGLRGLFNVVPVETSIPNVVHLEVPGQTISTDKIDEAARQGFVFSGIRKSYDDERVFVSNGQEYSIVRAHNNQPVASVNRKGEVVAEEKDEILKFWRLIDEVTNKNFGA